MAISKLFSNGAGIAGRIMSQQTDTDPTDSTASALTLSFANQLVLLFALLSIASHSAGVIAAGTMVGFIALLIVLYGFLLIVALWKGTGTGATA